MTQGKVIIMSQKEVLKCDIINNLIAGKIDDTEASKQLGLSIRQTKRLKTKVKDKGVKAIIHDNRGRDSNRKKPKEEINKIKNLIEEKYYDFGPTFAREKLDENHQILIGKETLRLLMSGWGLWKIKPRRNPKDRHTWRPRKDNFGEMQQFDGSYHL